MTAEQSFQTLKGGIKVPEMEVTQQCGTTLRCSGIGQLAAVEPLALGEFSQSRCELSVLVGRDAADARGAALVDVAQQARPPPLRSPAVDAVATAHGDGQLDGRAALARHLPGVGDALRVVGMDDRARIAVEGRHAGEEVVPPPVAPTPGWTRARKR